MRQTTALLVAGGVLTALFAAQEARKGGTQPGQVLPGPFPAYVVTGQQIQPPPDGILSEERQNFRDDARIGKFHDFVTRFGLDPTVAIFSREAPPAADQPLGKLLKALDQAVDKNRNARLHAFAIFLTLKGEFFQDEAQQAQIKQIETLAQQLQLKNVPLALDKAESERTKAYDIPADASVVVLVYINQTVQARFAFTTDKPLDDAGVQSVLAAMNKMTAAKNAKR
jgi:hypothetical protein